MPRSKVARVALKSETAARWVDAYRRANEIMEVAGFPRLAGAPIGQLLEIPGLSDEASQIAAKVHERNPDWTSAEWFLHLERGEIVCDVWCGK